MCPSLSNARTERRIQRDLVQRTVLLGDSTANYNADVDAGVASNDQPRQYDTIRRAKDYAR